MSNLYQNWPELLQVERPGRYLGGELEAQPNRQPDSQGRLLKVALAFPDVYEIAHGHLGHKILYSLLNSCPGFTAERVYAPWGDWEDILRRKGQLLRSLENQVPLKDFDLVGFSLQYELGYTNILAMMELGGLPLKASERDETHPLVAAGGPGAYNPEPLADFFDLFFLGDAEDGFLEDLEIIKAWRAEKAPKSELWGRLAGRPGIYIPALFEPSYDNDGRFSSINALKPGYEQVKRAVAKSLDAAPFPLCQITPLIKPVHDRIVVEIGRGCSRGCRFCQAGYIYRPVRERKLETVMKLAGDNLRSSGQDEVSLLSLSAGDHTQIAPLMSAFMDEYASQTIALSLPSLRVKSLKNHLARQIKRVRKTGFTLAPEAGTQRLRDVINKDLTDDDLIVAAEQAFALGWRTLKLYFMVGLPTETEEDLYGLATLARRIKKMTRGKLNLGVAHFTPKAHTPFQWHPGSSEAEIAARLLKIRDLVKIPGLTPKWNAPGASWVESILAKGDRRLGPVIEMVYRAGARFEAWGDRFDPQLWKNALGEAGLKEEFLLNPFQINSPLPYDHLFAGANKDFLIKEWHKAQKGETTADCRWSSCLACGACHDGAAVELAAPEPVAPEPEMEKPEEPKEPPSKRPQTSSGAIYLINFTKEDRMIFLGHLELVELFKRAFRRADLEVAQSEGFHPQPKLSLLTALPLGVPSYDEYLRVILTKHIAVEELAAQLAAKLPCGITIKNARSLPQGRSKPRPEAAVWRIDHPEKPFQPGPPLHPDAQLSYTDGKKRLKTFNLPDFILSAEAVSQESVVLSIKLGLNGTPKPFPAVAALWGLPGGGQEAKLTKLETILRF